MLRTFFEILNEGMFSSKALNRKELDWKISECGRSNWLHLYKWSVKRQFLIFAVLFFLSARLFPATITSNAMTGNWSTPASWVGGVVPGAGDDVIIANNANITVNGNYTCLSLILNGGNQPSSVIISGTNSLTVTNTTTLFCNSNNDWKSVVVDNGSFTSGSVTMNSTNNNSRDAFIEIASGNATVLGDLTMNANINRNYIRFTGAGILNVGGNISGGGITSTFGGGGTPTSGTVNLNGSVAQSIDGYTFYNFTVSGSGDKSQSASITVSNDFTMNGGNFLLNGNNSTISNLILTSGTIQLGDNNLTLSGTQSGGSASSMVVTDGNGYLIRNANATLPIIFPVGSDGLYDPVSITAINNTTGTILVRTTSYAGLGPKYISRYWDMLTSVAGKIITSIFQYEGSEISITPNTIYFRPNLGAWQPPSGTQTFGANTITITGTSDITTTNSSWTAGAIGTYYSYQTGNWNNPTTWTSDPGGTTQMGSTVPGTNDFVVILDGRTISLTGNVNEADIDISINAGGIIDMSTYQFTSGLKALRGQGTLQLASVNFPSATTNTFIITGGGTTEYNNSVNFTLPATQTTYNHLTINAPGIIATQLNNLTLNGNLYVKQGTYRINDNTANRRQLTIFGNVVVDNGASLTTGAGNTFTTAVTGVTGGTAPFLNYYINNTHQVILYGDFTNDGTVRFTNQAYPVFDAFPNQGAATVYFMGATNNTLTCNNTTDFYNLVLDKGVDQTFKLTIYSTGYSNFRLFGANTSGGDGGGNNPNLKKALWIRTGTLDLKGLTIIPSLTEGNCDSGPGGPNSDFYIPANGALILDGADVIVLSTADDYRELNVAYGVAAPNNTAAGISLSGCSSFSIYGKIKINNGYFSTRESGGFITWDVASGQFELNGGQVDAKQFRAAGGTGGLASYTQTGGMLYLRGRFQRTPLQYTTVDDLKDFTSATINTNRIAAALDGSVATFNLNAAENVFSMSGGTMRIYDVCGAGGGQNGAFEVLSSYANINVTGGTVEVIPTTGSGADATSYILESNAPVYNLFVSRVSGTAPVLLNTYPLKVLKNLTLQSGVLNANNFDVAVGGNFIIALGTTYTTGTNRTIFNGTGTQSFAINLATPLTVNKLIVDKSSSDVLILDGTQNTLNITDSLKILNSRFNDNSKTVNCAANIFNSGYHLGSGKIVLNSNAVQNIDGNGTGIFQNLELNKPAAGTAVVNMNAVFTINGTLTFSGAAAGYKPMNIQNNELILGTDAIVAGADANRYIQTSGNAGDGGLTRQYSAVSPSFTFPVGASSTSHALPAYTPATLGINGSPAAFGSITVIPVGYEHPATINNGRTLTYFWRVKSNSFTLGTATVTHGYTYDQNDVITGAGITENGYVAARYQATTYSWSKGTVNDVDEAANIVGEPGTGNFLENVAFIDGDYTAGDDAPTDPFGAPVIFYSRQSANWNLATTWSNVSHTGPAAATIPGLNDVVIIGNGNTVNLTGNQNCAVLQIENGSTLDIYTYTGSTFSMVVNHPNGNGLFQVTTPKTPNNTIPGLFTFPSGDFSDFNVHGGTTEFYDIDGTVGALYILPANVIQYGNLILRARGGDNLVLPNNAATTVYGDLTCTGNATTAWIAMCWNTNIWPYFSGVYNPTIEKTVTVKGSMYVDAGSFEFFNDQAPQHLIVEGDVVVAPGAVLEIYPNYPFATPVVNNTIAIGGSLINNNVVTLRSTGGGRTYTVDATFFGENSASITNTSGIPTTTLNNVLVNKGSSQSDSLIIDIGGTLNTLADGWLTLQNGTLGYLRTNPNSDFTITTTSPFTIPTTAGLYIDYSNSGNRDILLAVGNSDGNDVYLNGKLALINGNVYIGNTNGTTVRNNDIEYSGGGSSEIEIQGGNLIVNGQIRRNPATSAGVLKYTQSGGQLVINGQNANTGNAKLEILNAGSQFNMSGGSLTIVRGGGGNTFGDLYLRPASSTVTGGDIVFSQVPPVGPVVDAVQDYRLDATVSLNNLTITGKTAGPARNATVTLLISPLTLNGSLTLSNNRSFFDANSTYNINVTINGNLNNSGTYSHYLNTTTFNGNIQAITGTSPTTFYDLVVNPVTRLTLNGNTTVNRNLTLSSGTLECGNYTVYVAGNLNNNATYTDNNTGVELNGSSLQYISGTGTYGQLALNNTAGARLNNSITLEKNLVLTQGILDINKYLLSLGVNSNISGAPFSSAKMITSDGVFSNVGINKFFPIIGAPTTFTFPLGTTGKYTPAVLSINTNTNVGSLRLNNINTRHSAVIDPANVLDYYWEMEGNGLMGFNGNIVFNYLQEDVLGSQENNYLAARLLTPATSWSLTSTVDDVANTITINYVNTDNLSGEYTAGISTAFPPDIPEYTSNSNGDWTDNTIWTQTGGTLYPCPLGGPNGFIVTIDHEVTADANYCSAYKTTINNTLRIVSPYFGHNLGIVTGNGTLYLESGVIPAGRYTSFLDCSNDATLEYGGTGTYILIADLYSSVPNILLSGTGTRNIPNKDLTICHSLKIGTATDGPAFDNTLNNRKLTILGTMERYNTGVFKSGSGAGATVSFAGSSAQTIGGILGDFTGTNAFNNLEINNAAGLTINTNGAIEVNGNLMLTSGVIHTATADKLTIINSAMNCVIPAGGSSSSYVDGPLIKRINQSDNFLFPVGEGTNLGNKITLMTTMTGPALWTVEYHNPNTFTTFQAPLTYVNLDDYWNVTVPSANQAIVDLKWNPASDLTPLMTQNGLSDMRVAEHNSTDWIEISSSATGDNYNGSVQTVSRISFPVAGKNVTTACINVTKPRATLSPSGPVCGAAGILVSFTQSPGLNYTLSYTINGVPQVDVAISSLPYTLPTPVPGIYRLTAFTYNNGLNNGVVDAGTVTAYDIPTTADAGSNQSLCGATGTTLAGNTPLVGSGLWSIVSGIGGTVVTPDSPASDFNGTNGTTYTLRWTISNGSCTSSDDVVIAFPLLPLQPGAYIVSSQNVCQGQNGVPYSVPNDPSVSYTWVYGGTGATINGTGNSVTVDFSTFATSDTLSVRATNGCGISAPRNIAITVNALPVPTITGTDTTCQGNIIVYSTEAGMTNYTWSVTDLDIPAAHTIIAGGGITDNSITIQWDGYEYHRISINYETAAGCTAASATELDIWISKIPDTGPAYYIPNSP